MLDLGYESGLYILRTNTLAASYVLLISYLEILNCCLTILIIHLLLELLLQKNFRTKIAIILSIAVAGILFC